MATSTVITGTLGTTLGGTLQSGAINAAGFNVQTATVTAVTDGILSLQFARPSGYTGYWSVVGLEIATGNLPPEATQIMAGLEFEPGGGLSAASVAKLAAVEQRGVSLSEELVLEVREEVLAAWATTGLTGEAMQRLQSATIQITT